MKWEYTLWVVLTQIWVRLPNPLGPNPMDKPKCWVKSVIQKCTVEAGF